MIFKILTRTLHLSDVLYSSNVPASGSNAVVTIAGVTNKRVIIHRVLWSYSGDGAGRLTISDGNTDDFIVDITRSGPGALSLNRLSVVGNGAVVTLLGITATQGRLNVEYTLEHG